jgi:hypothetical protein
VLTYFFLVVFDPIGVLQVRVKFYLIDGGRDGGRLEDDVEMFRVVIAHADGFGQTLRLELFHLLPAGLVFGFVFGVEGAVNQVAVF